MKNYLHEIEEAIYNGDEESIEALVQQALDAGISPEEIIAGGGVAGLDRLGEDFNNLEVYLPELMIGGDCMKLLIEKVKPYLKAGEKAYSGKIVIGCAKGDLHDIGKSLVATQLAVHGFEVIDLGVDVNTNRFIDAADKEKADIIAVSALLTTSQYYMEELIRRLIEDGKRDQYRIAVGGGPISPEYAKRIGADGYSRTANLAVSMAQKLMRTEPAKEFVSVVD